ncbi:hypothetical protein ACIF80_37395 [Streptomyces sp. NPDC085927]|uniref:hypothetical protein n=1 Tax=Streptomyces sp. NPDC085927 TaxID=3365738 RepID=UPI0037CE0B6D
MTDPHLNHEPAEHRRHAHYLQALDVAPKAEEADLVTAVLGDEDVQMAQSAVVHHLGRRASQLLTDARFTAWAHAMAEVIGAPLPHPPPERVDPAEIRRPGRAMGRRGAHHRIRLVPADRCGRTDRYLM